MWPTLVELSTPQGPVGLHSYGLLVLLAFSLAFLVVHLRARRVGIHTDALIGVHVAAFVGGLLGARLLYALAVEPAKTLANPLSLLSFSGFAFYGGVLGGAAAVFAFARWARLDGWKLADVLAPALLVGLGVGRIGCFLAGCCHGAVVADAAGAWPLVPDGLLQGRVLGLPSFPYLALEFHGGVTRPALQHLPLYPTQIWSAAAGLGLATLLLLMSRRRRHDGQIAGTMLVLEPIARIFVETFRADERGYAISWLTTARWAERLPGIASAGESLPDGTELLRVGLTTSQGIGILMMAVGVAILVARRHAGVAPEVSLDRVTRDPLEDLAAEEPT